MSLSSPPSYGSSTQAKPFTFSPGYQDFLLDIPQALNLDTAPELPKKHKRSSRTKKPNKKHSKHQKWSGYLVQVIGLICLIMAAIKGFEPLAGVGFTLVIVGYKGGVVGKGKKRGDREKRRRGRKSAEAKDEVVREGAIDEGKLLLDAIECG